MSSCNGETSTAGRSDAQPARDGWMDGGVKTGSIKMANKDGKRGKLAALFANECRIKAAFIRFYSHQLSLCCPSTTGSDDEILETQSTL